MAISPRKSWAYLLVRSSKSTRWRASPSQRIFFGSNPVALVNNIPTVTITGTVPDGTPVVATATVPANGTSSFSLIQAVTSPLIVTVNSDSGAGSLREAINFANANGGGTITFDIGFGQQVITLFTPLPSITKPVIIDGTTQPGYLDQTVQAPFFPQKPFIQISGLQPNGQFGSFDGLVLESGSDGSSLLGLNIVDFDGVGIRVQSSRNTIEADWIGINGLASNLYAFAGTSTGISIEGGSSKNTIGGTSIGRQGYFSAPGSLVDPRGMNFGRSGQLYVADPGSNAIIGFDASSSNIPIVVSSGQSLVSPVDVAVASDKFSNDVLFVLDQTAFGGSVFMVDPQSGNQTVLSTGQQFVSPTGVFLVPRQNLTGTLFVTDQGQAGVADGKIIKVNTSNGQQTVISSGGNLLDPVGIDAFADGKTLYVADREADGSGVILSIDTATGVQTVLAQSTTSAPFFDPEYMKLNGSGQLLFAAQTSASSGPAIFKVDVATRSLSILSAGGFLGHPVGVAISNSGALFVSDPDVLGTVAQVSPYAGIVTTSPAMLRNVISGNNGDGIDITGNGSNRVLNTYIGTDFFGNLITDPLLSNNLYNFGDGIHITDSSDNTIGSGDADSLNVISGNIGPIQDPSSAVHLVGNGIRITRSPGHSAANNAIVNTYIGTDSSGSLSSEFMGNSQDGILIEGATGTRIGGRDHALRNVISGNFGNGIDLDGAAGTILLNNFVGTNSSGLFSSTSLSNAFNGVLIDRATGTTIGGTFADVSGNRDANVISGNLLAGIRIQGDSNGQGLGSLIRGNFIGTTESGNSDIGNGSSGVQVVDSGGNTIGGVNPGEGNVITGNNGNGILIAGSLPGSGNLVQGNIIGAKTATSQTGGNAFNGVQLIDAKNNTIGGATAIGAATQGAGNIIDGNGFGSFSRTQLFSTGKSGDQKLSSELGFRITVTDSFESVAAGTFNASLGFTAVVNQRNYFFGGQVFPDFLGPQIVLFTTDVTGTNTETDRQYLGDLGVDLDFSESSRHPGLLRQLFRLRHRRRLVIDGLRDEWHWKPGQRGGPLSLGVGTEWSGHRRSIGSNRASARRNPRGRGRGDLLGHQRLGICGRGKDHRGDLPARDLRFKVCQSANDPGAGFYRRRHRRRLRLQPGR